MPLYELGVVMDASLEAEERESYINDIRQIITGGGGEFVKEDVWGKRNLAYSIKHKREGYYLFWQFQAPGTVIGPLEYKLRISDQVLRYLTLNLDQELRRARKMDRVRAERKQAKAASAAAAERSAPEQEA
jgi:small subunit ribosomal protein S6